MVAEGVLEPVEYADLAAPVVAVLKSDRKSVMNPVAKLHRHPIPRVEDLFATLQGCKKFTKLDLSQAYQQLLLYPDSRNSNTQGLVSVHTTALRDLICSRNLSERNGQFASWHTRSCRLPRRENEHLQSLEEVLKRLERPRLRARKSKCLFMAPSSRESFPRIEELAPIISASSTL